MLKLSGFQKPQKPLRTAPTYMIMHGQTIYSLAHVSMQAPHQNPHTFPMVTH